jgi:glucose/arabinose dehydrogenase/cytochrome c2
MSRGSPARWRAAVESLARARALAGRIVGWLAEVWRRRRLVRWLSVAAAVAGLAAASGVAGYWAADRDIPQKVTARYLAPAADAVQRHLGVRTDDLQAVWERRITNGHVLEIAKIPVRRDGAPLVWALAPAGDSLVFSSRHGQLGYLDASNRLASLELETPMRLEALREGALGQDPVFEVSEVRTFDLLTVETGPQRYDLYASYARYAGDCFEVAVSRTPLEASDAGLRAATRAWEDVYVARPCLPIKNTGMRFAGHEGGGRLVMLDADTLLLSVGVFQFDNVAAGQLAGQDPSSDLGKIVSITLSTGEARIFASGFRNPQGLLVARDGRVWETEHGPQGGDEVNLIREGGNYGWPLVTYGMDYGSPPRDWPYTRTPGRHDGFDEPAFVFTPSIGISNIVEPDLEEFPRWRDHLVAASLTGGAIYVLQARGVDILAAEPITLNERLRDIVVMSDGRLAIATDDGDLVLVRNAEKWRDDAALIVTGISNLAAPLPEAGFDDVDSRVSGARVFHYQCGSCHGVAGEIVIGPPLNGVIGRRVGAVEGYGYSQAMTDFDGVWTRGRLRSFLTDPDRQFSGTVMPRADTPWYYLDDLIAYLASTEADEARPQ